MATSVEHHYQYTEEVGNVLDEIVTIQAVCDVIM